MTDAAAVPVEKTSARGVVVGVDGSEPSRQALRWAVRIAASLDAPIDAVTTWEFPTSMGWGSPYMATNWDPAADAEKMLTETVDAVFGSQRPVGLTLRVLEGGAARSLLQESAQAQMLIVGSRGHGGFAGLLLGSVSANCAEHAQCPVLVVHGNAP
jgi:nucleotide-binding universal stress UspA family protein